VLFSDGARRGRDSARLAGGFTYVEEVSVCLVEPYEDSEAGRAALAGFLGRAFGGLVTRLRGGGDLSNGGTGIRQRDCVKSAAGC
jgi:hypothetical protein